MKKILYTIMAIALISSATSCKKCGYCKYGNGQANSDATCSGNALAGIAGESYKLAKANCEAQGGIWVISK